MTKTPVGFKVLQAEFVREFVEQQRARRVRGGDPRRFGAMSEHHVDLVPFRISERVCRRRPARGITLQERHALDRGSIRRMSMAMMRP